jgi:hypothetical protein
VHEDSPPTDAADDALADRAARQVDYLKRLVNRADLAVLASDEMWR